MYERLLTLLKRPALWQRSGAPFWDDEHISKGMLEAHLDPEREAASRRHSDIDRSVQWLATMIPTGGRLLDLGCGPGLYTGRLSSLGYDVTGMDLSERSIAYAKAGDSRTTYLVKNYLELDDAGLYDAVIMIYCDYGALIPDERRALLTRVYRALKPGGLFLFDVFSVECFRSREDMRVWSLCEAGGFWSMEPYACLEATYYYENHSVSADQHIILTRDAVREYLLWNTAYTPQRLADELSPCGFQVKGVFDNVCGDRYTGETDTLCVAAYKPG